MDELIKALQDFPNIDFRPLESKFFGKYTYRVSLSATDCVNPTSFRKLVASIDAYLDTAQIERARRQEFSFRKLVYYMTTASDVLTLVDKVGDRVSEITAPRHDGDMTVLTDPIVRIRPLYWESFRWCAHFRPISEADFEEVIHWIEEMFGPSSNISKYMITHTPPRRIYFQDETEFLMLKMSFSHHIKSVTKVITREEIDHELQSTACAA